MMRIVYGTVLMMVVVACGDAPTPTTGESCETMCERLQECEQLGEITVGACTLVCADSYAPGGDECELVVHEYATCFDGAPCESLAVVDNACTSMRADVRVGCPQ